MEFFVLGKSKLKILLSPDDLERYGLCGLDADADLFAHRNTLYRLIEEAEKKCNFSVGDDTLLLQIFPLNDNEGAEFFVTCLSILPEGKKQVIYRSKNLSLIKSKTNAYVFATLKNAIAFSHSVKDSSVFRENCRFYITEQGSPMLEFSEIVLKNHDDELNVITEFAHRLSNERFLYLREHSVLLFENDVLSRLRALKT